ncbi:MAG: beta-galactosidase, partial [Acidobacteriaceae bacterium]|nr:beta-galactosidase [Acidobacteriaceae bacterium]
WQALESALKGNEPAYIDSDALKQLGALTGADLLILPYGSAFPAEGWQSIITFLRNGGNLLVIGGQPFRVPISGAHGSYSRGQPQDAYSREIGIVHTYQAPQTDGKDFTWKTGYPSLPRPQLTASKFFVLEGRGVDGFGYMENTGGEKVAAPVVVSNHTGPASGQMLGSRWVFLDFQPAPGYWDSPDGISLVHTAAAYAQQGATSFWLEVPYATLKKGETAQAIVHVRSTLRERQHFPQSGHVSLELLSGSAVLEKQQIDCSGDALDVNVSFQHSLSPGFYIIQGTYQDAGQAREFYQNGFWVEDERLLRSGPVLGAYGDFLTKNGKPFFPFGTNYFTTEENGWDFSGPRNAAVWERDFADMERHGVSFVRTGVWMGQIKFLEAEEEVSERFLRNVEAYLLCASQHQIPVNFTFFAFDPQATLRQGDAPLTLLPGGNPYLDPVTIRAEQNYLLSIVNRFKDVPYLSWDLINEPTFANPRRLWKGNTPNGDPAETQAWHSWLRTKYDSIENLSKAWSTTPDQLRNFDSLPLPAENELTLNVEQDDPRQMRAADYNLFAQEMFSRWVRTMIDVIRGTGSKQLINVGQDEGGVQNRVLNQFYGRAGVSFTTNHTYRQNDALLWDSLAAKAPGIPNIVGETGYQPVVLPNGEWRYDELTGFSLIERKWAYGFAAGTSGSLSWDWARELYFGIERSDGSAKIWEGMMRDMGEFAKKVQVYATSLVQPEVAIVLPQSSQLTQLSHLALEAQQNCVRALYGVAQSEA